MGKGYELYCKKCRYEIYANLGVGFYFPRVYQQTMEAAREGKHGERIQKFLEEHPDGTLDVETALLQCEECGTLSRGPGLAMYVRNAEVPRKEKKIWSVAARFEETDYVSPMELKRDGTYQYYDYGQICEKCGKPMKVFKQDNLIKDENLSGENKGCTEANCPECKEPLWIRDIIMWD